VHGCPLPAAKTHGIDPARWNATLVATPAAKTTMRCIEGAQAGSRQKNIKA
jgi:hypothetical protein